MPAKEVPPLLSAHPSYPRVAGVDEAGRGCLAGAVVAAAVILPPDYHHPKLTDSKKMSEKSLNLVYADIVANAVAYKIAEIAPDVIDRVNILQAALQAMDKAIRGLSVVPDGVLVDGNQFYRNYYLPVETVVRGDAIWAPIAAASVLAKVYRDNLMRALHLEFPQYGWDKNKSYGTQFHFSAIREHGLCVHHRRSFLTKYPL